VRTTHHSAGLNITSVHKLINMQDEKPRTLRNRSALLATAPAFQSGYFSGPASAPQDSMKSSISLMEATCRG
jgi:hypothetical protein